MSRFKFVMVLLPGLAIAACEDKDALVQVIEPPPPSAIVTPIQLQDDCDSASFNAALGAGTCIRAGSTTFDAFNAELDSIALVAAWRIVPQEVDVTLGSILPVINNGGEAHTYTRVAQFAGGTVPELNEASGYSELAPECSFLDSTAFIASGQRIDQKFDLLGDIKYQCCIHPWMQQIVHVHE